MKITAKLTASGVNFPNASTERYKRTSHNKFRVTVSNDKGCTSFDYYGSHTDWENGQEELDESGKNNALYCFLSDAMAGNQDFENFCSEMGYNEDSRTAERIHKACKKSYEKAIKLFSEEEISELLNTLDQ